MSNQTNQRIDQLEQREVQNLETHLENGSFDHPTVDRILSAVFGKKQRDHGQKEQAIQVILGRREAREI